MKNNHIIACLIVSIIVGIGLVAYLEHVRESSLDAILTAIENHEPLPKNIPETREARTLVAIWKLQDMIGKSLELHESQVKANQQLLGLINGIIEEL